MVKTYVVAEGQRGGGGWLLGAGVQTSGPPGTKGGKRLHHALPDAARCNISLLPDAAGYMPIASPDGATPANV